MRDSLAFASCSHLSRDLVKQVRDFGQMFKDLGIAFVQIDPISNKGLDDALLSQPSQQRPQIIQALLRERSSAQDEFS